MFDWIYTYSTIHAGLLFSGLFILAQWALIFLFRRIFHTWFHRGNSTNEMLSFIFSSFFVLYGLLVGLLAVAAYQNFSSIDDLVTKEASSIGSLYRDIRGYPEPMRSILQRELREYTLFVIEKSWDLQSKGIISNEDTHRITKFEDALMSFKPFNRSQEIIHSETFRQANRFFELRATRIANANIGITPILWWVVSIGSLISILLIGMFEMELYLHLILGGVISFFLGALIFTIAALDSPFRGEVSIGTGAYKDVYQNIMQPDDKITSAMRTLLQLTAELGEPKRKGTYFAADKRVSGLFFGQTLMNNAFYPVDSVAKRHNCTATLFVKEGQDYIRVSTNIRKDDFSRAVGTILDHFSPAMNLIREGHSYYGEATILHKPYMTAYEPIVDAYSNIIGIYYVGFMK